MSAQISEANAPAITGAVLDAILFNDDLKGLDVTGAGTSNATLQSRASSSLMVHTAADPITVQVACNDSGSIDRTEHIADPQTRTKGAFVIQTHDKCDDGNGLISDGRIEIIVDEFSVMTFRASSFLREPFGWLAISPVTVIFV
jgi:hypothetical protein